MISIVIPLYNQVSFTKLCLEYVEKNTPAEGREIILVDNASEDGTSELLASLPSTIKCIRNGANLGFAKACNQGAEQASGEYLIFLNNDTAPHAGWTQALMEPIRKNPEIGVVGPQLLFPDGTIQQAGVVFSNKKTPYHFYAGCSEGLPGANKQRHFQALTAACFLVTRADFFAAGRFDERYINGMEDMHFCMSLLRMGKKILYNPAGKVTHFESRSENRQAAMTDNLRIFMGEWESRIVQDDFRYLAEDGMDLWLLEGAFQFFTKNQGDARAQGMLEAAQRHTRRGEMEPALRIIGDLLAQNPYNPKTLIGLSDFVARLGKPEGSLILRNLAQTYSGVESSPPFPGPVP